MSTATKIATETEPETETFLPPNTFVGAVVHGAVPVAACHALLADIERRGFEPTGEHYPRTYRNNDRLVFDDEQLAATLFESLRARLPQELVVDGTRWTLHGLNSRFRACRYRGGQSFCIHRDGPHVPSDVLASHLTLQLYLDDVPTEAGGRTRFYSDATGTSQLAAIMPRRGSAIVFDHRAWHDGEPVTSGIKHVLRTDVMYRRVGDYASRGVIGRHRGYAWRVVACRDGTFASSGRDGTVRRWTRSTVALDRAVHPRSYDLGAGSVTMLVEDESGRLWGGTRSGVVALETGATFTRVADDIGAVLGGCALPTGGVWFATSRGTLVPFDRDGAAGSPLPAHDGWAWAAASYGDGVVSCGEDGRVALTAARRAPRALAELPCSLRAIAVIGRELLVGDTRGWLYRLAPDGGVRASWRAHDAAITAIALTGDGWVTSSEDSRILRWRGEHVVSTITARDFVTSVAVTGDGAIACAGYDGAIWLAQ